MEISILSWMKKMMDVNTITFKQYDNYGPYYIPQIGESRIFNQFRADLRAIQNKRQKMTLFDKVR